MSIASRNIFFATASDHLQVGSFVSLNYLVDLLMANPSFNLRIEGHTDNTGKFDMNQTLSEKRAASVKKYLVEKGIVENRLSTVGYGQTKPIDDNKSISGRAQNRRVEIVVNIN